MARRKLKVASFICRGLSLVLSESFVYLSTADLDVLGSECKIKEKENFDML